MTQKDLQIPSLAFGRVAGKCSVEGQLTILAILHGAHCPTTALPHVRVTRRAVPDWQVALVGSIHFNLKCTHLAYRGLRAGLLEGAAN